MGGPEGPWPPPPSMAKCPRFWAKCPPNLGNMPPFAPKCPTNLGKMPSICHQSAPVSFRNGPKCTIKGANFQNFLGEDPQSPLNIVLRLWIFHSNANWAAQHARVMCPLISLAPPAPIFWISPCLSFGMQYLCCGAQCSNCTPQTCCKFKACKLWH